MAIIATPAVAIGVWRLHTQGEESAARAEARSLLPADAHVVSEQTQSCGSDALAAHECVSVVFQLHGSVADQTAAFTALAREAGW